jgi:hypothetical protein
MPGEGVPVECQPNTAIPKPGKVRFVERCQPWMTVVSPIIAVLSFFAGTLYSAANLAETAEATKAAQWRQALQTVTFSESGLIPTAFLMQSFEDDARYGSPARQIEQTVLEQTSQPQTFDLVFGNMLANMQTPDQVNEVIDVGHQLDSRLYSLWWEAKTGKLEGKEPTTFEYFLQKPDRFFPAGTQQAELNRALVLMWQLDTFSEGLACVWGTGAGCPHPPLQKLNLEHLMVVNYALPKAESVPATLKQLATCAVELSETQAGYHCRQVEADKSTV